MTRTPSLNQAMPASSTNSYHPWRDERLPALPLPSMVTNGRHPRWLYGPPRPPAGDALRLAAAVVFLLTGGPDGRSHIFTSHMYSRQLRIKTVTICSILQRKNINEAFGSLIDHICNLNSANSCKIY
jgi:hypothetical protein